jgi:hypothetical protein
MMSIELQILDWLSKNWEILPVPGAVTIALLVVLYVRYTLMRVAKTNQKRIERLEKQIFQLQVFHAQHHPREGSDIIDGNKSSPDPES